MRSMNVRRSMIAALSVAVVAAGVVVPAYAADGDPMLAPDPSPSAEPTASPTPDPTSTPDSTPTPDPMPAPEPVPVPRPSWKRDAVGYSADLDRDGDGVACEVRPC